MQVIFENENLVNTLGDILAQNNKKQILKKSDDPGYKEALDYLNQ